MFEYVFINMDNPLYQQAVDLRYRIFFRPWNIKQEIVFDSYEDTAIHMICLTEGKVNGYARLNYEGQEAILSQIVVDEEYRNQGLGSELVKRLLDKARLDKKDRVTLSAKVEATKFYKKFAFVVTGDSFSSPKTGLPHIKMILQL